MLETGDRLSLLVLYGSRVTRIDRNAGIEQLGGQQESFLTFCIRQLV
ncbi:hypothetical protein LAY57_02605 [Argonema antarcticum A004/B2]|nr:hypothetical protein [Argonema antarcticum A004/B2]